MNMVNALLTWTYCDEAGDYVVPNVLSLKDLIGSRSDKGGAVAWWLRPWSPE